MQQKGNTSFQLVLPLFFILNLFLNELIMELAPILMKSPVTTVFVYGNPGTGKTALILELLEHF